MPSSVHFGQLYDLSKNTFFLKFAIRENRKFPYEVTGFFLGQLEQNFFLS